MATLESLTPADHGYLAHTLDLALGEGLGDDDICDRLEDTIKAEKMTSIENAWSLAYDWFRKNI